MGSVATEFSDLKYVFPVHVLMYVCVCVVPGW
jgi:hypothetical protein